MPDKRPVTKSELERLKTDSIASWRSITIAAILTFGLTFLSAAFVTANAVPMLAVAGIAALCAALCLIYAMAAIIITMIYEFRAREDYVNSFLSQSNLPWARLIIRDVLE